MQRNPRQRIESADLAPDRMSLALADLLDGKSLGKRMVRLD
ncbi:MULTISPECIES: hypothetical protein [Pseudoxanthomonas]|uniref:Oxidoreductase n=1 Tax=Pseudoxanthomonas winnipegensis TaxID=2480810 RepID=A0AAW8GGN9_9GAMM|nr:MULTISPECIES: hypothetical protein [Pseudoxanthomonas]MDQ1120922.1 hypothetical protein [Pseudoxanthomonas winnipegensis]MDQ1134148.1 hypothetical protein [Pseudoxanthomonas winnipegensis]MDR6139614.1 hypothetical protein [Pseudoxanthomonas sp. SORGH_AS_0997]